MKFLPNFIQSIRGIGNQFTKEDLFVWVESIDDQAHQLSDLGLESEGFNFFRHLEMIFFLIFQRCLRNSTIFRRAWIGLCVHCCVLRLRLSAAWDDAGIYSWTKFPEVSRIFWPNRRQKGPKLVLKIIDNFSKNMKDFWEIFC